MSGALRAAVAVEAGRAAAAVVKSLEPTPAAACSPADHAEKGSKGPQSDSPTSDAYAPAYNASFHTLRFAPTCSVAGAAVAAAAGCST